MKNIPFREHHILTFFDGYEQQDLPLDVCLNKYFRLHTSLGSKDRAFVANTIYGIVRWQGLLDYLAKTADWDERLSLFLNTDLEASQKDESIPQHIRCSFPQDLFDLMVGNYGKEKAFELCLISNQTAPTTIRANVLRTTRAELLQKWKNDYPVIPCKEAENGIIFEQKFNLFGLPEFKQGFFELQDEGSQLLSARVKAMPGQLVLDYCAGSGGKTLAFAPQMQGKGQIFLHDVRQRALQEARIRMRRAGIQNAQIVAAEDPKLKKMKKKMDWVLVDAPCSGTGTLRRNPDMKWKFTEEMLTRLCGQQRMIFEKALSFLKPGGHIVYATCSLLKEENQDQVEHFKKTYGLKEEGEPFQSLPTAGGMDGFFATTLIAENNIHR